MSLIDELRRLADLRQQGQLTDPEFIEAKQRLLADDATHGASSPPKNGKSVADAVRETPEELYRSSRWSAGNLFFPDRLSLSSDGISFRKGALFGSTEEHINFRAVASFKITNGFFLSKISIETAGGSQPILINGLWKGEAKQIQDAICVYQRTV